MEKNFDQKYPDMAEVFTNQSLIDDWLVSLKLKSKIDFYINEMEDLIKKMETFEGLEELGEFSGRKTLLALLRTLIYLFEGKEVRKEIIEKVTKEASVSISTAKNAYDMLRKAFLEGKILDVEEKIKKVGRPTIESESKEERGRQPVKHKFINLYGSLSPERISLRVLQILWLDRCLRKLFEVLLKLFLSCVRFKETRELIVAVLKKINEDEPSEFMRGLISYIEKKDIEYLKRGGESLLQQIDKSIHRTQG